MQWKKKTPGKTKPEEVRYKGHSAAAAMSVYTADMENGLQTDCWIQIAQLQCSHLPQFLGFPQLFFTVQLSVPHTIAK